MDIIKRASSVNGLTHVDLNYPDHTEPSLKEIANYTLQIVIENKWSCYALLYKSVF